MRLKIFSLINILILFAFLNPSLGSEDEINKMSGSKWMTIPNGQARWIQFDSELITKNAQLNQLPQFNMGLHIKLDKDWHTYWENPGDSGAPTDIFIKDKLGTVSKTKIYYPYPERINVGPLITYGYSNELIYFFNLTKEQSLQSADLLVCKEECVPGTVNFNLADLNTNLSNDETFQKILFEQIDRLPKNSLEVEDHKKTSGLETIGYFVKSISQTDWEFSLNPKTKIIDFFWSPEVLNNSKKPIFIRNQNNVKFYTSNEDMGLSEKKMGLLVYNQDSKVISHWIKFHESSPNIFLFFLMAFMGGLILNLMPCVFPIVSLKAFSILKTSGQELKKIRQENLAYSFGVVLCFILMGLTLSILRTSGSYLGWGFQLQNPYVVMALALVFFILSLSFFDLWSWNWIPRFATKYYSSEGLSASFFTGLLAVIVASPCTAPFMGAAIGFALTQSTLAILIVFLGLGLGMSLPFLLMAFFPKVSLLLPRPGMWMVYFKKLMGLLLMATVVWLIWVFIQLIQPQSQATAEHWQALNVNDWSALIEQTEQARFINFTADWCVTCKVNERLVFSQDSVRKYVNENKIKMYKVDWTRREDLIAKKLAEFGRAGVPMYLYFPKGSSSPVILPELLTPNGFISNLENQ